MLRAAATAHQLINRLALASAAAVHQLINRLVPPAVTAGFLVVVLQKDAMIGPCLNALQHSYFNLAGHASGTILGHQLTLHGGDHYTPVRRWIAGAVWATAVGEQLRAAALQRGRQNAGLEAGGLTSAFHCCSCLIV